MPDPKTFHDAPPLDTRYKSAIDRAKMRTRSVAPPLENTPAFDSLPKGGQQGPVPGAPAPKKRLSPETAAGLDALGRAQQQHVPPPPPAAAPPPVVEREEEEAEQEEEQEEVSEEVARYSKMRKAVEARCPPIDLYQYLSTGSAVQDIPIIKDQFTVRMRTASEYEEGWVDKQLAQVSSKAPMSQRQVQRLLNELGLAVALVSINGTATGFPVAVKPDGTVDEEAMAVRVSSVRKLSSPIFTMLVLNLGWFVERVNETLSLECLKNG